MSQPQFNDLELNPTPRILSAHDPQIANGISSAATQAEQVQIILKARDRRGEFINSKLFGEPAWDMLLELYLAELRQFRVPISSLGVSARVAPTTALRWIETLDREGLISKRADPLDRRRIFVELSAAGSERMRSYFFSLPARKSSHDNPVHYGFMG